MLNSAALGIGGENPLLLVSYSSIGWLQLVYVELYAEREKYYNFVIYTENHFAFHKELFIEPYKEYFFLTIKNILI